MKKLLLLVAATISFAFDKLHYEAIFNELKKPRIGLDEGKISKIKDPFMLNQKSQIQDLDGLAIDTNSSLHLQAIFGKMVKISSKWYRHNEIVNDYKITQINENNVILKNKTEEIKLEITKESRSVEIK